MTEQISHPTHYNKGKTEVWDFILDQNLDFLLGNVVKYVCRAGSKGDPLTDIKKAKAYVDKYIQHLEAESGRKNGSV
jgi:hypothetical protein